MQMTSLVRNKEEWESMLDQIEKGYVPIGGKRKTYDSGMALMSKLHDLGVWKDGDYIFDIGCGNGRLAIPLVGHDVKYKGFDVIPESIKFCKNAFRDWKSDFSFDLFGAQNDFYNPAGEVDPAKLCFPIAYRLVNTVLMASVMTHIGTEDACLNYLSETRRVLRPDGKLYVTWFRSPPNDVELNCERTCFSEAFIMNAIKGFEVEHTWGGFTNTYHDQWCMILRKES